MNDQNAAALDEPLERLAATDAGSDIYKEHFARYVFASKFTPGKTVLDVACGSGYGASWLKRAGAKKVVGADIDPAAIKRARDEFGAPEIDFLEMDAVNLKFPDNSFEVVVSFETLEHLNNQAQFIRELRRVLKPGGVLIISTPNKAVSQALKINNRFHRRELKPREFEALVTQYFTGIRLFGQRPFYGRSRRSRLLRQMYFVVRTLGLAKILRRFMGQKLPGALSAAVAGLDNDFQVVKGKPGLEYIFMVIVACSPSIRLKT